MTELTVKRMDWGFEKKIQVGRLHGNSPQGKYTNQKSRIHSKYQYYKMRKFKARNWLSL